MYNGANNLYEFGDFRLDVSHSTLWREAEIVPLSPKALELLTVLIERGGQVVSKQEIFQTVWADTFVEDGVLTQNIYTLRNALGPDENGKQFIETVPRRGYRFAGAVIASKPKVNEREDIEEDARREPEADRIFAVGLPRDRKNLPLRPLLFTAGIILSVAALGLGLYQVFLRGRNTRPTDPSPIEQVHLQRLTDTGDVLFPTISPDGETLAFVRSGDNEQSVWVQQTATGSSTQTLPPSRKGYASLAFSPDGEYLFFRESSDGGSIFQVPKLGGSPRKVAENVWSDLSLSTNGKQVAFVRHDTARNADLLIVSDVDTGSEKEISVRSSPDEFQSGPAFLPDGNKLAIATHTGQEDSLDLQLIDIASRQESELKTPKWRSISSIVWMPDGRNLIVSAREKSEASSQLWMLGYPDGNIRRLTNDLENYFWISRTANGEKIVTRQQHIVAHLWLLPAGDLKKAKQLTTGGRNLDGYVGLAWTTNGKVIFSARSGQVTDLYSIDPDGGNPAQLTSNAGQNNTYPNVSKTGAVVFMSNRIGTAEIWRMNADGGDQRPLSIGDNKSERIQWPTLSPDGREIFFLKRSDPAAIWKIPFDGGTPELVSRIQNGSADGPFAISPDGRWLAYRHVSERPEPASGDDRTQRIGAIRLDGSAETKFFDLPVRRPIVQWTTNDSFDFSAGTFNSSSIVRQSLTGGDGQKLLDFPDRVFNFAWSRDGKNLVVSRGQLQGDALMITNLP